MDGKNVHQLIVGLPRILSHCVREFNHPFWCKISFIPLSLILCGVSWKHHAKLATSGKFTRGKPNIVQHVSIGKPWVYDIYLSLPMFTRRQMRTNLANFEGVGMLKKMRNSSSSQGYALSFLMEHLRILSLVTCQSQRSNSTWLRDDTSTMFQQFVLSLSEQPLHRNFCWRTYVRQTANTHETQQYPLQILMSQ